MLLFLLFQDKCRNVSCPVFNILRGNECVAVYSGFENIPKEVVIMFKEVNGSISLDDPYTNIRKDVFLSIIMEYVVSTVIDVRKVCVLSLYRKNTINHYYTDFILRFGWKSSSAEDLVPRTVKKLFNTQIIRLDFTNTSRVYEAKLLTNLKLLDKFIFVSNVSYVFWFSKHIAMDKACRTVLQIGKLLVCKRITLSVSELNNSDGKSLVQSDGVLNLPMEYRISSDDISVCLDDYLNYIESKIKQNPSNPEKVIDRVIIMLSFFCSIISIVSLCITVFTYLVFKTLRTVPGKINLCLCLSLISAQILQTITIDLTDYHIVCIICGILIHFCWSATLLWMNVASFYLFYCFCLSARSFAQSETRLWLYSIYVFVFSSLLIGINVVYSFLVSNGRSIGYGIDLCYISSEYGLLYTFIIPAGGIVLTNCCFLFAAICWISRRPKMHHANMPNRNNILIYLKMSTLTGICWLFGFLRLLIKSDTFEVLFILTNGLQGMMLMLSFVCNKRVFGLYKQLINRSTN